VGNRPLSISVNPITNKIYVIIPGDPGSVTVIDGATYATTSLPIGSYPIRMAINTATNKVYVTTIGHGDVVAVIDGATNAVSSITVPSLHVENIAINPTTNRVYVAPGYGFPYDRRKVFGNVMTVIDGATGLTTAVTTETGPFSIAVNAATNKVYISSTQAITILDGITYKVDTRFVLPDSSSLSLNIAVNPVTNRIYATRSDTNNAAVIDDTRNVVEFYNTVLDHFFITGSDNEASIVDNGGAGPGWIRTGQTFKSGGATPVCRFYGSMSPGPNSHYYTVDPIECDFLKNLQAKIPATEKRWNFEQLDFATNRPVNGQCPSGTAPIYLAYNNGYAIGIDSNFRITPSLSAIQEVVKRGWISAGVAMCAPS
jgi:DNA-binding beta-propeller fold protein YncE